MIFIYTTISYPEQFLFVGWGGHWLWGNGTSYVQFHTHPLNTHACHQQALLNIYVGSIVHIVGEKIDITTNLFEFLNNIRWRD